MVVTGRDGQTKAHPLINAERDARKQFHQTFKQLGIKS
jgi:phage terminase small subunit